MPSPFPGMDPYLEGAWWTTLHFTLAAEIVRQLAPRLRPRYLAMPVERFVMDTGEGASISAGDVYPDVAVTTHATSESAPGAPLAAAVPLLLATVIDTPVPHVTIEIRDRAERRLVTAIELLSPTNKRGAGREEYLAKRRRMLLSTAHLLEIDLLREGRRVPMQQELPDAQYFIVLSRASNRPLCEVWPVLLDQPLPEAPVPLLPGDADVLLDLQGAFTAAYDLLGYDLTVDYTRPPEPALPASWAAWAQARVALAR
jgi:hypothetical protein